MSDSRPTARRAQRLLIGIGLASLAMYSAIAVLSSRFALTVPSVERPHLTVLGIFGTLFVGYFAALRLAVHSACNGRMLGTIVGFAIGFRLVLLASVPIQEIDLYRYIWDGNVVASGHNPYRYSPAALLSAGELSQVDPVAADRLPPDLVALVALGDRTPALSEILRTVHFAELTTPYPPVSQAVFALAAVTTPDSAPAHGHVILMKTWIVVFDLAAILAMAWTLRAAGASGGWLLAYAWCPLVMKEFANSGHLDSIAVALTTAAIFQIVVAARQAPSRVWTAGVLLGLGIGAKLYPLVLVPVSCVFLARQQGQRSAVAFTLATAVVATASLLPMITTSAALSPGGAPAPPPIPTTTGPEIDGIGPDPVITVPQVDTGADDANTGLAEFLTGWRMNDFLFLIVNENLNPSRPRAQQPWFAVVPERLRFGLLTPLMSRLDVPAQQAAFLLARGLTLMLFSLLALWWTWKIAAQPAAGTEPVRHYLEAGFLTLAWFWLLAPTQNPWYWTWCLPLIPFARSRLWLLMSAVAMTYYLRFWLNAWWPNPPGPLGSRYGGALFFDFVVVWFEFAPLLAALFIDWLISGRFRQQ